MCYHNGVQVEESLFETQMHVVVVATSLLTRAPDQSTGQLFVGQPDQTKVVTPF